MAYLHNNEYYTGYFAEGSSDYAGQQGPGYTRATIDPTTNSAKTVNIYFAEPVICESASGSFYKASAPSYKTTINVQYRLNSTKAWTSTRPSEPIDGMILTNSQISGYSQGLSGFVWTFESKFTWGGEPDPEPDPDPTKYYYVRGTGGSNTCTSLNLNVSGNVRFECVVKLNGTGFIPWGMSPDSGWGGSEDNDCRFFTTTGPNWYFDYGSYRHGPIRASAIGTAIQTHKIKIEGSAFNIKVTDLDEDTVLINQTISSYGVPNGPWMLGTTNNFQFYEGKVWNAGTDTILLDCKADQNGLRNKLTNTYYSLNNVAYGNYDTVIPPVVYPDLTPQVDNYSYTFYSPLVARRRLFGFSGRPLIVAKITMPMNSDVRFDTDINVGSLSNLGAEFFMADLGNKLTNVWCSYAWSIQFVATKTQSIEIAGDWNGGGKDLSPANWHWNGSYGTVRTTVISWNDNRVHRYYQNWRNSTRWVKYGSTRPSSIENRWSTEPGNTTTQSSPSYSNNYTGNWPLSIGRPITGFSVADNHTAGWSGMDFYGCRIYRNNILVNDLYPAILPNGTPVIYDTETGKHYEMTASNPSLVTYSMTF